MKLLKFYFKHFAFRSFNKEQNIEDVIKSHGFRIYPYRMEETNSKTTELITALGCESLAKDQNGFVVADSVIKGVFIRKGLSKADRLAILFHEEGHIWYNHLSTTNFTDKTSTQKELEAQLFLPRLRVIRRAFVLSAISLLIVASLFLLRPLNSVAVADEEPQAVLQTAAYTIQEADPIPADLLIAESSAEPAEESIAATVYITPSGERYHRPDCYHIKNRSTISISKTEAENFSKTPCKTCQP